VLRDLQPGLGHMLHMPTLPDDLPLSRALQRYARAVAFAATGRLDEARAEQQAFATARAKVPADPA
jgi:hypothetical protein